jgi:GxxExxY protein
MRRIEVLAYNLVAMCPRLSEFDRNESIIGGFYSVYNYYGYGFIESVYAGTLTYELEDRGHRVARELAVAVRYKDRHVSWQRLDMVVDDRIILELKATEKIPPYVSRQVLNNLRATRFEVGLLLHFGPEPKVHRYIDSSRRRF